MLKAMSSGIFSGKQKPYRLGLGLQGGGSYGAYQKGVIKALLESGIDISAVAGTSAGAVNGSLLAYGLNSGDAKKAIKALDGFWNDISREGAHVKSLSSMFNFVSFDKTQWPNLAGNLKNLMSFVPSGLLSGMIRDKVNRQIKDWSVVQNGPVKLFVNATRENKKTGEREHIVFKGESLSSDAVAASCSLEEFGPHRFDGHDHYDGAYWRNPCFEDLENENITDLMIVTLLPPPQKKLAAAHQDELRNGLARPGFELLGEQVHQHIAHLRKTRPDLNIHVISLDVDPVWDETSRMNADPKWLSQLEETGYRDGQKWVQENSPQLGLKTTYVDPASSSKMSKKLGLKTKP